MYMAKREGEIRRGPTGREDAIGAFPPDSATLHPGLFSFPPSGRKCGDRSIKARG
jgi:hypothetical protein